MAYEIRRFLTRTARLRKTEWIMSLIIIIIFVVLLAFVWIACALYLSGGVQQAIVDFGREIVSMGREMVK